MCGEKRRMALVTLKNFFKIKVMDKFFPKSAQQEMTHNPIIS